MNGLQWDGGGQPPSRVRVRPRIRLGRSISWKILWNGDRRRLGGRRFINETSRTFSPSRLNNNRPLMLDKTQASKHLKWPRTESREQARCVGGIHPGRNQVEGGITSHFTWDNQGNLFQYIFLTETKIAGWHTIQDFYSSMQHWKLYKNDAMNHRSDGSEGRGRFW